MCQESRWSLPGYRSVVYLLTPILMGANAWQAVRAGDARLFRQRLGFSLPRLDSAPLWLHAASVGELIAAEPLIAALRRRYPHIPVVVTTFTATGARVAAERLPADVRHFYLPMDWPGAAKRFLRAIKPRAALIMETELWPGLFARIAREDIPLIIVNGRLSERTLNTWRWVRRLYALSLKSVTAVLARSERDAEAYIRLGASAERVQTLGNIKFALPPAGGAMSPVGLGRPFVLAASTHEDEERQLAAVWKQLDQGDHLLVIAPRHPERRDRILQQLRPLALNVAVRSHKDPVTSSTEIYLADTLGELEGFMAGAALVFMGGSLVPRGGHNILEPARLGKPVLFGPCMDNFQEESRLLLAEGAALQVADAGRLRVVLGQALADPESVRLLGVAAQRVMSSHNDVLERYVEAISHHCLQAG